jgi:tetratricopeptide (TPR) repeat protein
VSEWLVIILLAFSPFAFGVVGAWSEEIVVVLASILFTGLCVKAVVTKSASITWTWAYVPVLAFIAVGIIQMISLPVPLVRLISPNTVTQKLSLLGDLYGTNVLPSSMQISFYPYATGHDLRLVLAVAAVFAVVLSVFRRPDQIMRLLLAIAVIGAGVAIVALAQDVAGNGKIYWFATNPHGRALSGPFVNHSHYAQFMNLSIGAALAAIFVKVHEAFGGHRTTPAAVAEYLSSSDGKLIWGLCAMIALAAATIFASLSRGGMISLMIAGSFTTLVLSFKRSLRGSGWIVALLALGAFVCVLYVGFDAVYERLGTLRDLNRAEGGRWQIVKDVTVAWTRFPIIGAGLGTHEVVYPMFDRSARVAIASHAENEYAQAAEETGLIGLAALATFAVFVWRSYARTVRESHIPIHSAAYGLGFGLIAILTHSLSDFGQHLPANALLSAIFCALLIRLPRVSPSVESAADQLPVRARPTRWRGFAALAVVCLILGWATLDAEAARRGAAHWSHALASEHDLAKKQWQGSNDEYRDLLEHAANARDCQTENVDYGYWLNTYRWRAISRLCDPNTGMIVQSPEVADWVDRITTDLKRTLSSCPTFGPGWCVLGQMELLVPGHDEEAARHIERGRTLAPCHPTVCLVAGLLHMDKGDIDAAFADWKRAVELDDGLFPEVASLLVSASDKPDLALQIAGDRIDRLVVVAGILETSSGRESAGKVRGEVVRLLEQKCREPDAPAPAFARLASACQRDGRLTEAIEYYRRALALDYGEVEWRFNLASLLADTGDIRKAIQEVTVCLRFRPEYTAAKWLLDKLSLDSRLVERTQQSP